MHKFLIVHRGALGDFILTWPAIHALREIFPDLLFVGVGRLEYMRLAIKLGLLDSCYHAESSGMIKFFAGLSIPFEFDSLKGAVLWLSQGEGLVNFLKNAYSVPVVLIPPFPSKQMHVGMYHYLAVQSHFPIKARDTLVPYFPLELKNRDYALIHPGSGSPAKNYDLWLYQELAEELRRTGYTEIYFVLGPVEDRATERSLAGENVKRLEDLEALAKLQAKASLYIGNDSGASHLAGVLGTATIVLYKITDPKIWGVLGQKVTNLKAQNEDQALRRIRECLKKSVSTIAYSR